MATVTSTPHTGELRLSLDDIHVRENVRDLDPGHVDALAQSIALRGLLVPLIVRHTDRGYELVAGYHRIAACRQLGHHDAPVVVRDQEGSSADSASENVVRKQLTPLETGTMASDATLVGVGDAGGYWVAVFQASAWCVVYVAGLSCRRGGSEMTSGADATLLR